MKNIVPLKLKSFLFIFSFLHLSLFAQVGIGTTSPNGVLDVNSTTSGIVFPNVVLTATNTAAPVVNPNGVGLVPGTFVYNTATTNTGANDVSPGLYVWDGSRWLAQFEKRDSQKFDQITTVDPAYPNNDAVGFRVSSNNAASVYHNIHGLTARTFTPRYTGTYKIEIIADYGPGVAVSPTFGSINVVAGQGMFRFTFDGTNYDKYVNAITVVNNAVNVTGPPSNNNVRYFAIFKPITEVIYVQLTANQPYTFNLAFDQWEDERIVNNANSGNGRGVVGVLSPGHVEFTYIQE